MLNKWIMLIMFAQSAVTDTKEIVLQSALADVTGNGVVDRIEVVGMVNERSELVFGSFLLRVKESARTSSSAMVLTLPAFTEKPKLTVRDLNGDGVKDVCVEAGKVRYAYSLLGKRAVLLE